MLDDSEDELIPSDEHPRWAGPTVEQLAMAAFLCYRDDQTDEQIAAQLGVCRRTLSRWKRRTEFIAAYTAVGEFDVWQTERAVYRRSVERFADLP